MFLICLVCNVLIVGYKYELKSGKSIVGRAKPLTHTHTHTLGRVFMITNAYILLTLDQALNRFI